jgi:MFS family permease
MGKNYYLLLTAYFISSIGDWLYRLAIPLLLFKLTHSPLSMAVGYALTFLPFLLVSPFGGIIADRLDRRHNLIYGDYLSCFTVVVIIVAGIYLPEQLWLLYGLIFLAALISPLYHPSFQSIIPALVDTSQLAKANAFIASADNAIMLLAPLIGGGIIAILGVTNALYLNALSFLLSALLITGISLKKIYPASQKTAASFQSILGDLKEGFYYAWSHPVLKYGALLFVVTNFAIHIFYANFMYYLVQDLHLTPQKIGMVFTIIGIGAVAGSLCAPFFIARFHSGRLISGSTICAGIAFFTLLWFKDTYMVAAAWAIVTGFGCFNVVVYFTLRQRVVPREFLGRAIAITRLISYSSIPVASILGGWLLERTPITTLIFIGALLRFMIGCWAWFSPLSVETKNKTESISESAQTVQKI